MVRAAGRAVKSDRLRPGPWRRCAPEGGAPPPWPGSSFHGESWRDQPVGQLTIGGEQQKTRGVPVQPAHGGEVPHPEGFRQQAEYGGEAPVLPGRHHPLGFVHHEVQRAPGQHRFPVQGDLRAGGEGGSGSLGYDSVHPHPSPGNGVPGLAAAHASVAQVFVQAHGFSFAAARSPRRRCPWLPARSGPGPGPRS